MSKKRAQRNKGHSRRARDHRLYANCRVWTWEGLRSPVDGLQFVTSQRHSLFGWIDMGHDLAQHLLDFPRNWMIGVRALCRNKDGQMWMESAYFDLPSYNIQQIEGAYHKLRADVLAAQRTDHVFDMGWICQTWAGKRPDDALERWHYHHAPAEILRQVIDEERDIQRIAGPGYSEERWFHWQDFNLRYLIERKWEQEQENAV